MDTTCEVIAVVSRLVQDTEVALPYAGSSGFKTEENNVTLQRSDHPIGSGEVAV